MTDLHPSRGPSRLLLPLVALLALACASGPPAPATRAPDCVGWCEQRAACGGPGGDCATTCAPGGADAHRGPASYRCAARTCGEPFDGCAADADVVEKEALRAGALVDPPPDWPDGFPFLAGGVRHDVPVDDIQAVALLFDVPSGDVADVLKAEAARTGWAVTADEPPDPTDEGPHVRLTLQRDAAGTMSSVDVSVYEIEGRTVLLVMAGDVDPG